MQNNEPTQQPSAEFAQLADLWSRRGELSETEWHQLYGLVMNMLATSHVAEESSLAGDLPSRRALRHGFFVDKVLLPAYAAERSLNPHLTPAAMAVFYKRYLIDLLRKQQRQREEPLPEDDAQHHDQASTDSCRQPTPQLSDVAPTLDIAALRASASRFLQQQEHWVILYLALHFGNDSRQLPLSTLQARYCIPSYHYKAVLLGTTSPRGGFARPDDYADTMIGRWLQDCGIALCADNDSLVRAAIDLLCQQAGIEFDRRDLAALEIRS